jgi:hypothetical protein
LDIAISLGKSIVFDPVRAYLRRMPHTSIPKEDFPLF